MKKLNTLKGPWAAVGGTVYDVTGFSLARVTMHQQPHRAEIAAAIAKLPEKDALIRRLRAKLREYIRDQYEGTSELKARLREIP